MEKVIKRRRLSFGTASKEFVFKIEEADNGFKEFILDRKLMESVSEKFRFLIYKARWNGANEILVTDMDCNTFGHIMRYATNKEVGLISVQEALAVARTAKDYHMPDFLNSCVSYIITNMTNSDALEIFEVSYFLAQSDLRLRAVEMIISDVDETCLNVHFLPESLFLRLIVNIYEKLQPLKIFELIYYWAIVVAEKCGSNPTEIVIRKHMEPFLPYVMFLDIPVYDLLFEIQPIGVLTKEEVLAIACNCECKGRLRFPLPLWCSPKCLVLKSKTIEDARAFPNGLLTKTRCDLKTETCESLFSVSRDARLHGLAFRVRWVAQGEEPLVFKGELLKDDDVKSSKPLVSRLVEIAHRKVDNRVDFVFKEPVELKAKELYQFRISVVGSIGFSVLVVSGSNQHVDAEKDDEEDLRYLVKSDSMAALKAKFSYWSVCSAQPGYQ